MKLAAIVLAAGSGTRFQSKDINKVTLSLAGKPIILYGISLLEKLGIEDIFVVVGFAKESVVQALADHKVTFVEQKEQLGTANAVALALEKIPPTITNVLVVNGDDPFHKENTINKLIKVHQANGAAITFTTANLTDPTGMGRIVRDSQGKVEAIIEEKDTSDTQRRITEVNGACYIFTIDFFKKYLPRLTPSKSTEEYYLTGLVAMAANNGERVETVSVKGKWKGINSPQDLQGAEKLLS